MPRLTRKTPRRDPRETRPQPFEQLSTFPPAGPLSRRQQPQVSLCCKHIIDRPLPQTRNGHAGSIIPPQVTTLAAQPRVAKPGAEAAKFPGQGLLLRTIGPISVTDSGLTVVPRTVLRLGCFEARMLDTPQFFP